MIPVTLEYKLLGFLWRKRLETQLPARWSEMNARQIVAIPDLQRGKLDESKLLEIFLGIKRNIARRIDSYQKFCILRYLKYISEPEPLGNFVIKSIDIFHAPENNLKGVTFGAFIFGDTYYQNYLNGRKEDLNRFIACYYTISGKFYDQMVEEHALIIKETDLATREAIAINYALIREWLAKAYPYVFRKAEEGKKHEKFKGWVEVFDNVVGDDIVNADKVAKTPLSMMLRHLNRKTKQFYKNGSKVQRPG
jgi:hypothetical protein